MTMYYWPFKDRAIADRLADDLLKAGMRGRPFGYYPAFEDKKLSGEKIKNLLFGSKATGINLSS